MGNESHWAALAAVGREQDEDVTLWFVLYFPIVPNQLTNCFSGGVGPPSCLGGFRALSRGQEIQQRARDHLRPELKHDRVISDRWRLCLAVRTGSGPATTPNDVAQAVAASKPTTIENFPPFSVPS